MNASEIETLSNGLLELCAAPQTLSIAEALAQLEDEQIRNHPNHYFVIGHDTSSRRTWLCRSQEGIVVMDKRTATATLALRCKLFKNQNFAMFQGKEISNTSGDLL